MLLAKVRPRACACGRPVWSTIVCEISSDSENIPGTAAPASCGTDISGTGYTTAYSYTLATPTTTITQGAQTRVFQSDWLGRPTSVQEPESGTTSYSYAYNGTGLVVTRQRPQANQPYASVLTTTTTQYDALGRVVSIGYSDGTPTKTFAYDTSTGVSTGAGANFTDLTQTNLKGRLSLASVPTAMTAYSYDPVGRTSTLDECLPSGPCGTAGYNHRLQYTYDWAGNMLTSTDDGGVQSTYALSPANEILSLTSSLSNAYNPASLVSGVQNGPNGPLSYNLGNGLSSVYGYDALGRLNGGWVCSGSTSAYCSGGAQVYGFTNGWKGAQLTGSSDSVLGQGSTYGYDEFNRLASRTVNSGTVQNFSWVYDRYGNRWQQNVTAGSGPQPQYSFYAANNQMVGLTYDAAGNVTSDGSHYYTYDAEGHITAVDGGSTAAYVYNALNQRVRTVVGGATTEFVFNAAGQRVSVWNGTTRAQLRGQYYWGGRPVAFYASGAAHFQHQDWLGTERMRTAYNGGVEGAYQSLPFGDGQSTAGSDLDPYHYAQLDHDTESDTDHAQFRQYANAQGRWLSPDSYGGSYDGSNPQSFNRYAYAANNPLSFVDPTGLYVAAPGVCDSSIDPGGCGGDLSPGDNDAPTYVDQDGDQLSASSVNWLESMGAASPCPYNDCSLFNQIFYGPPDSTGNRGVGYNIVATAGGFEWANAWGNEVDAGPDGTGGGELPFSLSGLESFGWGFGFNAGPSSNIGSGQGGGLAPGKQPLITARLTSTTYKYKSLANGVCTYTQFCGATTATCGSDNLTKLAPCSATYYTVTFVYVNSSLFNKSWSECVPIAPASSSAIPFPCD
jgi:RHS repeat-associated protein